MNNSIHINQIGYRTFDEKILTVTGQYSDFQVVDESNNETVFSGKLSTALHDDASAELVAFGDFSEVKKTGKYHIIVDNLGVSCSFEINDKVYLAATDSLLKALYYQRCGTALDEKHAGPWKHNVCHNSEGVLIHDESKKLDVSGGWHDAGDYGRYVVPAGKAVADLLLSYEFFPKAFDHTIDIPESGNNMPDILNEAKYEIDWLFKMQDTVSGGAYHKVATRYFPGMIMPEDDNDTLLIFAISSPATADFAATMALASRIYKSFDEAYSEKCLAAAEKAWNWLMDNPEQMLFKNPQNVNSGEYGDRTDIDERFWAAAELFKTTGNEVYHNYFKEYFNKVDDLTGLGWADMGGYGSIAYLFTDKAKVDTAIYEKIQNTFIAQAEKLVAVSKDSGYKVALTPKEYIWGSNMEVLDKAMILIIANILKPNKEFTDTALYQWHYIYGLNSLNQSYVSGFGSKPLMNPHHRPSEGDGVVDPVPGMVSGGPCAGLQDQAAREHCTGNPPAKCFVDHAGSYSTNEITIYWNSPGVFVGGYLNS